MIDYVSKHDLIETISRKLTPKTVGEMLDWADWLWYHFDTYTNALKGAVRYFLGDIDIEARNDSNNGDERRKITTELFRDYDIMDLLGRVGDEFIQWGNCFTSIEPVVRRKLYCPNCHATVDALQVSHLAFRADDNPDNPVFFGDCPVCGQNVGFRHFEVIDASKPLKVSNGFKFERRSPMAVDLRKVPGTYSKLAGILERCHAFIGTISGAYHVAQSLLPGRTLMLCPRAGEWRRLYRNAPVHINMRDITKESIRDWLLSLPESP